MSQEEKKNEEIKETSAYEPTEEGYDPKKEKRAMIGWAIFFGVVVALMIACIIVICSIPTE